LGVVARRQVRVGLAGQRLDGLGVAGIDAGEVGERGRRLLPVLLLLAHQADVERDLLGVALVLEALGVFAVVLDGLGVLAQALARQARAAEGVGGVRVLRVARRQLLVQGRRLVVVRDVLLDARRREQRLGRVRRLRVLVGQLLVRRHRLVALAAL